MPCSNPPSKRQLAQSAAAAGGTADANRLPFHAFVGFMAAAQRPPPPRPEDMAAEEMEASAMLATAPALNAAMLERARQAFDLFAALATSGSSEGALVPESSHTATGMPSTLGLRSHDALSAMQVLGIDCPSSLSARLICAAEKSQRRGTAVHRFRRRLRLWRQRRGRQEQSKLWHGSRTMPPQRWQSRGGVALRFEYFASVCAAAANAVHIHALQDASATAVSSGSSNTSVVALSPDDGVQQEAAAAPPHAPTLRWIRICRLCRPHPIRRVVWPPFIYGFQSCRLSANARGGTRELRPLRECHIVCAHCVDDLELALKALSIPRTENELVQAMRSVGLLPKLSLDDLARVEDGDLSELELEDVERRRAREQPIGFEAFQRILVHLVVERARY